MDGLFLEHGPFRIIPPNKTYEFAESDSQDVSKWRIEINPYSWHRAPAYTLYIDQPVGTGLSFSRGHNWCKSDYEVNNDFYNFLQQFLAMFKDLFVQTTPIKEGEGQDGKNSLYQMSRPLYFSGESHAGHYIPSMIDHILTQNDKLLGVQGGENAGLSSSQQQAGNNLPSPPGNIIVRVQGAAIGNGWVDPVFQYSGAKAAYGVGLIDEAQFNALKEKEIKCQAKLREGSYVNSVCFQLLDAILEESDGGEKFKVSSYDSRLWEYMHKPRTFPVGHDVIESFLGNISEFWICRFAFASELVRLFTMCFFQTDCLT